MTDDISAPRIPPVEAAADPEAPVEPAALLLHEERALLLATRAELGCALAVVCGETALLGELPPAAVRAAEPAGAPLELRTTAGRYLSNAVYHDGERLALVVAGPYQDAQAATARFLCQLGEQLLYGGLRRTLAARMHLASVQDAYCDLQSKNVRLSQALQRMQELDRVKANFLATVSHELRTPLTSVIGYAEMLMEGLAGPLNEQQREYLGTVLQKGDQLLQIITGLLSISRIEAAGVQLQRAPLDLGEVIKDVARTVAPHARRKSLTLAVPLPESPLRLMGDRDKLRQVVLNLVSNAIKFTPEHGTVRVTATAATPGPGTPHEVVLTVSDTGIGIPEHLRERIFEPFYQVDSSPTRAYEGTGLGLSIVRKFVEAHGGRVWVAETRLDPGHNGTIFMVALPLEIDPATASGPAPLRASASSERSGPVASSSRSFRPGSGPGRS